jgi:hypothetical protein
MKSAVLGCDRVEVDLPIVCVQHREARGRHEAEARAVQVGGDHAGRDVAVVEGCCRRGVVRPDVDSDEASKVLQVDTVAEVDRLNRDGRVEFENYDLARRRKTNIFWRNTRLSDSDSSSASITAGSWCGRIVAGEGRRTQELCVLSGFAA